ncbi:MAG: hypothetical protein QXG10_00325 [Candidatus Hadarchaeales archaeon]
MKGGLAASDIIRSMLMLGYGQGQIYEVLTCAGLNGETVQLLIDRILAEIPENVTRKSELKQGLDEIKEEIESLRNEMALRINTLAGKIVMEKAKTRPWLCQREMTRRPIGKAP